MIKRGTMIRFSVKRYGLILFPFFVSLTLFCSIFSFSDLKQIIFRIQMLIIFCICFFQCFLCHLCMLPMQLCLCTIWLSDDLKQVIVLQQHCKWTWDHQCVHENWSTSQLLKWIADAPHSEIKINYLCFFWCSITGWIQKWIVILLDL